MRGKVSRCPAIQYVVRITPAYAGKSFLQMPECTFGQDHPRLCGEKIDDRKIWLIGIGSPPPMRGKGSVIPAELCEHRITPAYAGKSDVAVLQHCIAEDHPRLCGEKFLFLAFL